MNVSEQMWTMVIIAPCILQIRHNQEEEEEGRGGLKNVLLQTLTFDPHLQMLSFHMCICVKRYHVNWLRDTAANDNDPAAIWYDSERGRCFTLDSTKGLKMDPDSFIHSSSVKLNPH